MFLTAVICAYVPTGLHRMCPGRHFAMASLFIYVASVLQVFDIRPKKDPGGKTRIIIPDMVSGVVTYEPLYDMSNWFTHNPFRFPAKFECDIAPRSANAAVLINTSTM